MADKVRVNVQLIDARTDGHLWAQSFDRKLDDVFAVESEVAYTIAEQLKAKLSGREQKALIEKPTENSAAYNAYLRGVGIERGELTESSYQQAALAYANAVDLDPSFALAWARLSLLRSFLYFSSIDKNTNSAAAVKDAADKAIALQPDLGEAWLAQGAYRYRVLRDFAGALQAYGEAQKRLPNSALINQNLAFIERRLGHWKEAEMHFLKAAELDPRNVLVLRIMADELFRYQRRYRETQDTLDRALQISPNDPGLIADKADAFQEEGRLDEAAKQLARIPEDSTDSVVILVRGFQAMLERRFDAAAALFAKKAQTIKPGQPTSSSNIIGLYLQAYCEEWAGRPDEARATFEQTLQAILPSPNSAVSREGRGMRAFLALTYAGLNEKEKALEQANQAVADYKDDAIVTASAEEVLARIHARFGDVDLALAALPHLLKVPGGVTAGDLRFSPYWDPLRKDPRFEALIQRLAPTTSH